MSIILPQTEVVVVDSPNALLYFLDSAQNLPVKPPSLYLDLEGIRLSRHGSISIISLYVIPTAKIYLIDIYTLGGAAFSTTNSNSVSLKTVLESPAIPKVIFDVRNDSDALFSHFQISVDGIKDLQLMELASRMGNRAYVAGLAKCIEKDSPVFTTVKTEWQHTKDSASRLYNPEKGGRYEVFNERPMRPDIKEYCARDVALLPGLYGVYAAKLQNEGAFWRVLVREATTDRIKLSQSTSYNGQSEDKCCGPWDEWSIQEAMEGMKKSGGIYGLMILFSTRTTFGFHLLYRLLCKLNGVYDLSFSTWFTTAAHLC
ncbi:hypothetical protein VC83_03560 [Pseudogymnoascus destructans]|uniref:3'-5' exonuclease domain-containing protein n=1 Tax=Pseudogymnoascus destructans TaxID=655981 RepID=A0A177AE29_9PEZI|nr:uncharacterized protein VC83_03560 [Pseudogymnoascus destructans]OAF60358.1 hypothetical protein VC83_03560 [Pseudogymnoascus destructans]